MVSGCGDSPEYCEGKSDMYCRNCGTKNPDTSRFCSNCGNPMNGAPVQRNSGKTGSGFFTRILVSLVVFVVFYSISYLIASGGSDKKNSSASSSSSKTFEIESAQPDGTIKINKPTEAVVVTPPAVISQTEPPMEPEGYIESLPGYWEQVNLKDGNFNLSVSALTFYQTVYNCTGLTVNMNVTMNAGTSCKDWQVWGRSGSTFVKIGTIYLPNGDGFVSQSLTFRTPVTFDSIAVTPTVVGGYSWSMGLSITDVYAD